jgi:AcrR family transcriptional regulator
MNEDTREDIMGATYCALCKHGYAELTMQDIADETDRSKATLHYHYDTKEDLLLAFLEYLYASFERRLDDLDATDPAAGFLELVDEALYPPDPDNYRELQTALLEVKAQAPYDDAYQERLAEFDALLRERFASVLAEGIDRGVFVDDADPERDASFLVTVVDGAHLRRVAAGEPIDAARRRLLEYAEKNLLADDAELPSGADRPEDSQGIPDRNEAAELSSSRPDGTERAGNAGTTESAEDVEAGVGE